MEDDAPIRHRRAVWPLFVVALAAGAAFAVYSGWIRLPPNALPWEAPDLTNPPGPFAHLQIDRLIARPESCFETLTRAGVKYTRVPDRETRDACGYANAVRIDGPPFRFDRSPTATCGLAAALVWHQHEVGRIAERELGARVVRIGQLGTFACRNVNSDTQGSRSQHATANAIDIASYALSDGRLISVARDWNASTPEGRFLVLAHEAACRVFNGVLGPDYNRLHANHFHLDLGAYRMCR